MLEDEDFQDAATLPPAKHAQKKRSAKCVKKKKKKKRQKQNEDGFVLPLRRLCLHSMADNMKAVWAKDYEENYLDRYHFSHIMGPFNILPAELVKELTDLLSSRKMLSRAVLHLLLVPQLQGLSLAACPGLVTPRICSIIAVRCQYLSHLDLSGAQQASSQAQVNMLSSLPTLHSLSLAGTPCDRGVIRTIARHCPALRHLDVSNCHLLSPAALLPLGGGACFDGAVQPSDSSASGDASTCHPSLSPSSTVTDGRRFSLPSFSSSSSSSSSRGLPLRCLLATDIGFGEEEGEAGAAAAYLLLSLPSLEKVALEGLDWAFSAIHCQEFHPTEELARREGVTPLEEVWRARRKVGRRDGRGNGEPGAAISRQDEEEGGGEEGEGNWEVHGAESPDGDEGDEESSGDEEQGLLAAGEGAAGGIEEKDTARGAVAAAAAAAPGGDSLTMRLRDVQGLSTTSLEAVGLLCPHIQSMAVNVEVTGGRRSQGGLLAAGLGTWSGQLRGLTLQHMGPLEDLLPTLQETGSTLVSLTLEGVRTGPHCPLLEVLQACPRLRELVVFAQPPATPEYEGEEEEGLRGAGDLLSLPHLCSVTLSFDYEQQTKPVMSWRALQRVLLSLLWGSPLLERLSLTALPCHLDAVLGDIISSPTWKLHRRVHPHCRHPPPGAGTPSPLPSAPLGHVTHLGLARSDVTMATVMHLVKRCRRVKFVDLSCCWKISRQDVSTSSSMSPGVRFAWQ